MGSTGKYNPREGHGHLPLNAGEVKDHLQVVEGITPYQSHINSDTRVYTRFSLVRVSHTGTRIGDYLNRWEGAMRFVTTHYIPSQAEPDLALDFIAAMSVDNGELAVFGSNPALTSITFSHPDEDVIKTVIVINYISNYQPPADSATRAKAIRGDTSD